MRNNQKRGMVSASMYSLFLNWPWISGLSNHIPLQKNIAQPEMRGMVSAYTDSTKINRPGHSIRMY